MEFPAVDRGLRPEGEGDGDLLLLLLRDLHEVRQIPFAGFERFPVGERFLRIRGRGEQLRREGFRGRGPRASAVSRGTASANCGSSSVVATQSRCGFSSSSKSTSAAANSLAALVQRGFPLFREIDRVGDGRARGDQLGAFSRNPVRRS